MNGNSILILSGTVDYHLKIVAQDRLCLAAYRTADDQRDVRKQRLPTETHPVVVAAANQRLTL